MKLNELTDNQISDFYKLIHMVFVKGGEFRPDSTSGRDFYSQQLLACYGRFYKKNIIQPLMDNGYIKLISDSYKVGEFSKKYAITDAGKLFWYEMRDKVRNEGFTGHRSRKKVKDYIQDRFNESKDYTVYSIRDARIHSSWVSVPRDFRHSFTDEQGCSLRLDIDLKSAYPSMLGEYLEGLFDNIGLNSILHCISIPDELREYLKLLNGDFYKNMMNVLEVECSRPEFKDAFNCILNSSTEQRNKLRGPYRKISEGFKRVFPGIDGVIRSKNKDGMYMGAILARRYESPIVYNLNNRLQELGKVSTLIIHDGIEVWSKEELTETQRGLINFLLEDVTKDFKYIRFSAKVVAKEVVY